MRTRGIIFTIIFSMLVCMVCPVHTVNAKQTEDYKTFSQGDVRWKDYTCSGTNYTIGSAGCFITSCAVILAYAYKGLRDVNKFNPKICGDKLDFTNNMLIASSVKNIKSTFTLQADDRSAGDKEWTEQVAREKVVGYFNQGYYCIIESKKTPITTTTHFSPIVGVKDGVPVVWDVNGGLYSDWNKWAKEAGIFRVLVFKSSKTKSTDTMQGSTSANKDTSSTKEPTKEAKAAALLTAEEDLVGMPVESGLTENQIPIILPDRDTLSISEVDNVEKIGQAIRDSKKGAVEWFSIFLSFIGLLLILYSVMMFVAMIFDVANNFIEISLVGIITLGHCRLILEDDNNIDKDKLQRGDLTKKMWGIRAVIVLIVGMILVSGIIRYPIAWLMGKVLGGE